MKILLFENRYSSKLFRKAIEYAFEGAQIVGISEYRGLSDIWIGSYLYDNSYDAPPSLSQEAIDDVIARDRALAIMNKDRADRIVRRYWNGLCELFDTSHFDCVISVALDRYGEDILFRKAAECHLPVISPVGSFMSEYAMFTQRGELTPLHRGVSQEEISRVLSQLVDVRYLPKSEEDHVRQNHRGIKKYYIRRRLIESFFYPICKVIERDPDNHQYNVLGLKGRKLRDYYREDIDDIFTTISDIEVDRSKSVYLPLHFIPEASTSYWCQDVARLGYLAHIQRTIEASDPSITFLIKEHPSMYGKRLLTFYEALLSMKNVRLIHPLDRSNMVLEKVDTVVVDTGTVGIEALLRGKRVIALADSYYSNLHPNVIRADAVSNDMLSAPILAYDSSRFLEDYLDGLFYADFFNGKGQEICSYKQLGEGFRLYVRALSLKNGSYHTAQGAE